MAIKLASAVTSTGAQTAVVLDTNENIDYLNIAVDTDASGDTVDIEVSPDGGTSYFVLQSLTHSDDGTVVAVNVSGMNRIRANVTALASAGPVTIWGAGMDSEPTVTNN